MNKIIARIFRWIEGILYGPIWLNGSDWFGEIASKLEDDDG